VFDWHKNRRPEHSLPTIERESDGDLSRQRIEEGLITAEELAWPLDHEQFAHERS
jgi:hypothetical protein